MFDKQWIDKEGFKEAVISGLGGPLLENSKDIQKWIPNFF